MSYRTSEALVTTTTEDGVQSDGLLIRPARRTPGPIAVVWIYGAGDNFYRPSFLRIGRALAGRGIAFIGGNTRGHDYGSFSRREDGDHVFGGVAWEMLEDSPHDVGGWVDFAVGRGYRTVALAGHKHGLAQGDGLSGRAAGLAGGRNCARLAAASPGVGYRFAPEVAWEAGRLVAEGRGADLVDGP